MMLDQIPGGHDKNMFVCLLGHSHQPLQRSLLVDLIGAVCHVGIKVGLSVLANNVADVIDQDVLLVSFLQLLEEPEERRNECQRVIRNFTPWNLMTRDSTVGKPKDGMKPGKTGRTVNTFRLNSGGDHERGSPRLLK